MHVISRKKLRQFWKDHPDAERPLSEWFKLAKRAEWNRFADARADYPHADQVGRVIVFNIGGNKCRMIVEINYRREKVFLRHVLTHEEYSKGNWKN
jgi:mRNA interferase HigB